MEKDCAKRLRTIGRWTVVLNIFVLIGATLLVLTPAAPGGELGTFALYVFVPLLYTCGAWGLLTGIGLFRRARWARLSLMTFSGLVILFGTLLVVILFQLPAEDMSGWELTALQAGTVAVCLVPFAIAGRWLLFLRGGDVRAYFNSTSSGR